MVYVALLRAVNVGGHGKLSMSELKAVFERLGFTSVTTFINSGNVIFAAPERSCSSLATAIEAAVAVDLGLSAPTLVLGQAAVERIVAAAPANWVNSGDMKCDVMFLWPEVDFPATLRNLPANPELEDAVYVPGALIWRVDRVNQSRSGIPKLMGTPIYRQMTIRNINTVRKILALMQTA